MIATIRARALRWWTSTSSRRLLLRTAVRVRALFLLSLAGGVAGLLLSGGASGWRAWAGWGFAVLGAVTPVVELLRFRSIRENTLLRVTDPTGVTLRGLDTWLKDHGYSLDDRGARRIVRCALVDDALASGRDTALVVDPARWRDTRRQATDELRITVLSQMVRNGQVIFDAKKPRANTDPTVDDSGDLTSFQVRQTTYLDNVFTNDLADKELVRRGGSVLFRGADLWCRDGAVERLAGAACSNSIGVSTIALDRGHGLYVVLQARRNVQSAGKLAPTGSGSADWSDVETAVPRTLRTFVVAVAERELREEAGVKAGVGLSTHVVGFGRWVARGAKPEFFCVTVLDTDDFHDRFEAVEELFTFTPPTRIALSGNRTRAARDIARYIEAHDAELSFPLYWCLRRLEHLLRTGTGPSDVRELFT